MSSQENNKALVRRFYEEAWNQKNLNILEETHAPGWVHYDPSTTRPICGAGRRATASGWRK